MAGNQVIFTVRQSPEGGYEARAVGHSIFTQAETMDKLKKMVKEAVACHFADKEPLPLVRLVEAQPRRFGSAKGRLR